MFSLFRWVCRYLSFKLIAGIICSLALACGLSLLWGLGGEEALMREEAQLQGQQAAEMLAASLATHRQADYPTVLAELLRADGNVQSAIVQGEAIVAEFRPPRPEAWERNWQHQYQVSASAPIPDTAATLQIEFFSPQLQALAVKRTTFFIQRIGLIFVVTLVLVALLIRFRVCLPLQRLENASEVLGQGNLECPIALRGNDELQRVAQILDELRQRLRQKVQQYERQQEQLRTEMHSRRTGESTQSLQQQQQALLARLGYRSLQGSELEDLIRSAMGEIMELLHLQACRVYRYEAMEGLLEYCPAWSLGTAPPPERQEFQVDPSSNSAPARALLGPDASITNHEGDLEANEPSEPLWLGIQTLSGPFGALEIVPSPEGFATSDRFFLQCVANILSGAMSRDAAYDEIRQEIKRHTAIFANSLDGLLTIDSQGTILAFNPAAEQLFEYSCDQVMGQNFVDLLIPSRHHHGFHTALAQASTGEKSRLIGQRTQTTAVCQGGQEIPVELVLTPLQLGNRRLFNAFVRDLRQQRQAEQELEYSYRSQKALNALLQLCLHQAPLEELLQRALDQLLVTACQRLLPRGGILLCEHEMSQPCLPDCLTVQSGLSQEEIRLILEHAQYLPQGPTVFQPSEWVLEAPSTLSLDAAGTQSGTLFTIEAPTDTLTELTPFQPGEVKLYCVPIQSDGHVLGVLAVYLKESLNHLEQDLELLSSIAHTLAGLIERKRGELALREAKEAAEAASRAKSLFLANMSHEVRTPLGAVLGLTELLFDPELSEEDRKAHLYSIGRNSQHLLAVLNDILDLSKIEAGEMELQIERCSPWEQVENVLASLKMKAKAKGLSLVAQAVGSIPRWIETDPTRLRQILVNYLSNAIKFTQQGQITLRAMMHTEEPPENRETSALADEPPGRWLCLEVEDTGIGIPQTHRAGLFQPFQQGDNSASRTVGGTGLGLSICKRLATAMGGEVGFRSAEHGGSIFWLCLPLNRDEATNLCEPQESSGELLLGKRKPVEPLSGRVLLAEDTPDNQKVLKHHLQKAGLQVELANNGQEAIEQALQHSFDLLLMDMQMPVLDGYQATQQLRQAGYSQPIIALTAHAMRGDRERCLSVGCNEYLTKPVDPKRLLETLRVHLPQPLTVTVGRTMPEPIISEFAEDQEFMELVREYATNLSQRVGALRAAQANGDWEEIADLAHQNTGAGGMYGYPQLSEAARQLEQAAKQRNEGQIEAHLSEFEHLVARIQAAFG